MRENMKIVSKVLHSLNFENNFKFIIILMQNVEDFSQMIEPYLESNFSQITMIMTLHGPTQHKNPDKFFG